MKIIGKQGNGDIRTTLYGYEHDDLYDKFATAFSTAGERKVVGKTKRVKETNVQLPQGSEIDLEVTTLICVTEDGKTHFVEGEFPLLKKHLTPIVNKIKSSCSIGGSRVSDVRRKLKAESL